MRLKDNYITVNTQYNIDFTFDKMTGKFFGNIELKDGEKISKNAK